MRFKFLSFSFGRFVHDLLISRSFFLSPSSSSQQNRAERKDTVSTSINAKIAKRNANLAARVKQAKDKKAGIKTKTKSVKTKSKSHAGRVKTGGGGGGRAGFEGKGKK